MKTRLEMRTLACLRGLNAEPYFRYGMQDDSYGTKTQPASKNLTEI